MSATFYDLLKYAKTGVASPSMTAYDKQKALAMCKAGFPVKTLTGVPPISFRSDGTPLIAWSISGNMTQSGTPTPSAPIQPEETGDRTANLFDKDALENGYINSAGNVASAGSTKHTDYIPVEVGSTYTLTTEIKIGIGHYFAIYNAEKTKIGSTVDMRNRTTVTVNIPENGAFVRFSMQSGDITQTAMFNKGTAQPYEPYGKYKIPITLAGQTQTVYLSEPLRKALDGSDAVDVLRSDGTLTREVDSNGDALVTPTTETVTVPTLTPAKGANTLTVGTTLQPSSVSITGGIK